MVGEYTTKENLVVLSVGLSLGIKDTSPVFSLEVGLVVNINLNLNILALSLDRVSGDSDGVEDSTNKLSKTSWAPVYDLTGLKAELGSKDGVRDGTIISNLTEGKGLVDRRALITKSIDGSLGVDGDANGKSAGNTRGGESRGREVVSGDAFDVLKFGLAHRAEGGGAGSLGGRGEGSGRADKGGDHDRLHFE